MQLYRDEGERLILDGDHFGETREYGYGADKQGNIIYNDLANLRNGAIGFWNA